MPYDDTNRGALFKNDDKQADNHPDYRGKINVAGTDYWLDAWIKTSKAGNKFMSLSVKPKEAPKRQMAKSRSGFDDLDDDIQM